MQRRPVLTAVLVTAVFLNLTAFAGRPAQRKKNGNTEPKPQILPLPPELPMALAADTASLDFHISPLLKTGGLSAQIRQSLNDLIRDTHGETIVKLRAFVSGAGDARRVRAEVASLFTERKLPLPVLSVVQVGGLGEEAAAVEIEAVVATKRMLNPNGLAFLTGEIGGSFPEALERLKTSAKAAGVTPDRLLTTTCFTSRIEDYSGTRASIQSLFPNTAITIVQAVRDPASDASMCEAIGQLTRAPEQAPLVWLKDARATLVNTPQLVFTGLQLSFGSYLDDAHEAFVRLQRATSAVGAVAAPVEINAFSLDASAGSAIKKNASVPMSTFTVQTVEGLPSIDASAGIEAVLAPNAGSPVTVP
jgi:enamine deaminase RidA (YjgF/YER057c/UK114 family)